MGRLLHLRGDPHEETQRLLPWYVAGTLDAADQLLVESHLSGCDACRRDVAEERGLQRLVRATPLETATPAILAVAPRGWRTALRQPVRVNWFLAVQAAMVVLCVGIGVLHRPSGVAVPAYRALGDATTTRRGNLLVMFAPGTSPLQVKRVLASAGAARVEGPTAAGAFLLLVPPGAVRDCADRLARQPGVATVQPIDQPPS